jgi:hypothetical protein
MVSIIITPLLFFFCHPRNNNNNKNNNNNNNYNKYRLIHGHFHIGLVIIPRPPYWPDMEMIL